MTQPRQISRWHAQADAEVLAHAVVAEILDAAKQALVRRGAFHLVLAGGNTPQLVYRLLRQADADWTHWHLYFGDERCLPPEHAERNSRMAADAWLDHVAVPRQQIHFIPGELGAQGAAAAYADVLAGVGEFDLVLLGFGEDGHTASLFPGHDWGTASDAPDTLAVLDSPKPPPQRVSLSARRLAATRQLIFLTAGASKRDALAAWRSGESIPAAAVMPAGGVDIFFA